MAPRSVRGTAPLLLLVLPLAACQPSNDRGAAPRELETVDVTRAPDAALSTAEDAQERRVAEGLSGVLPDGFPADLPLFRPASLVEMGELGGGGQIAEFDSPAPPAEVANWLAIRWRAKGWRPAAGGVWTSGERRVTLTVVTRPSGCRFSIAY